MPLDATNPHPADELHKHRALLDDLIEIGADRIRLAHQLDQARIHAELARLAADPGGAPTITAETELQSATAYQRRFHAVRLGMLLARRFAEPLAASDAAAHRTAARRHILRTLEDDIQHEWRGDSADHLRQEVLDRLDSPEIEDDIGIRPSDEIIAEIRRDLSLGAPPGTRRPWKRRTPEDITELHTRAARPPASTPCPVRPRALWSPEDDPPLPEDAAEAVSFLLEGDARLPDG